MDVEPCYPLFSAELESTMALASSQQKFQTLDQADCSVMMHLLLMMLVCSPMYWGCMNSNPDRTFDEKFASLLPLKKIMR